jgi:glycerophosphoryl diester phosphodiesterase
MARTSALRLAHRGDWRRAAENTIPALLAALAIPGCDGLEFDVRTAADDVPVLLHDETLERVFGRPQRPGDLGWRELVALGVPTLERVLAAVPATAFLDVEVKAGPPSPLVGVLEDARGRDLRNAVVSSFVPAVLRAVRAARPAWPLWLNSRDLAPGTLALARDLGCVGVSVEWRSIDAGALDRAARADLEVAAWTVRRRATFDRLARLGVIAVCVEAAALDG